MSPDNQDGVMPTVKEVCVLEGPAYGQCWGCPVTECPLWIEPNALTSVMTGIAMRAAIRLQENRTVVEGLGGHSLVPTDETHVTPEAELGFDLADALNRPDVKRRLQVWMAAEAAVLRVPALRSALVKAEDQHLREWMRAYQQSDKEPTDSDVMQRDARIDRLEASIAAQVYGVPGDTEAVREAITYLKGHNLKPTAEYRRDHTR